MGLERNFFRVCSAGAGLLIAVACGGQANSDLRKSGDGGPAGSGGAAAGGSAGASGNGGSVGGGAGAGAGGGGVGGVGGGGAGGGGGGPGGTGASGGACAAETYRAELFPLDMLILFDQSGSMAEPGDSGVTVWDAAKGALVTFVQDPSSAGLGVGLAYFPLLIPCTPTTPGCVCPVGICPSSTSDCRVASYTQPEVPIQTLPGVASRIVSSLGSHAPGGGTPTHPALTGAMQYATSYALAAPTHRTVVVLVTDGAPNDCSSTVANVSQVAASGVANSPVIRTFVIGIGNTGNLDQIAQAGGTQQAARIDPANAGSQFVDALNRIRDLARACEFTIPTPSSGARDFGRVNVRFVGGSNPPEYVYQVLNSGACDPVVGGWYYDNPVTPTRIVLCPASCGALNQSSRSVEVELGCKTLPQPP